MKQVLNWLKNTARIYQLLDDDETANYLNQTTELVESQALEIENLKKDNETLKINIQKISKNYLNLKEELKELKLNQLKNDRKS